MSEWQVMNSLLPVAGRGSFHCHEKFDARGTLFEYPASIKKHTGKHTYMKNTFQYLLWTINRN